MEKEFIQDQKISNRNADTSFPLSNENAVTIPPNNNSIGTESFATIDSICGNRGSINPPEHILINTRTRALLTNADPLPEAHLVHNVTIDGLDINVMTSKTKKSCLVVIAPLFTIGIISLVLVLVLKKATRNEEDKYKKILKTIAPISGGEEIFNDKSPNSSFDRIAALEWMVKNDTYPMDNEWRIKQRYVLILFFFSTKGLDWYDRLNFLSSVDECIWRETGIRAFSQNKNFKGILCNEEGKVTEMMFSWNNLSGTIPHEIGNLNGTLTNIDLMGGSLSSTIPETLGNLGNLKNLFLGENCFTGTVPKTLSKLNLKGISLRGNIYLSGSLNIFSMIPKYAQADCGSCPGSQELIECDYCICCESTSYQCCNQTGIFQYTYMNLDIPSNQFSKGIPFSFNRDCISEESQDWQKKECPYTFKNPDNGYDYECTKEVKKTFLP